MSNKKQIYFRIILVGGTLGLCLLAVWLGIHISARFVDAGKYVIPINKDQLEIPSGNSLKHFYTYKPEQALMYEAPWLDRPVWNHTNLDGLVDRFNYSAAKPPGVFRIIALGDSFTQGILVETGQSYPELLEDRLQSTVSGGFEKVEVLNFGVGGYDVEYAANKLRLQGIKYNPDLVMWLVKFDDFYLVNERMTGARGMLQDELESIGIYGVSRELENYYHRLYGFGELYARTFGAQSMLAYQIGKFREIRKYYRGPLLILYFDEEDPMVINTLTQLKSTDPDMLLLSMPAAIERFPDTHPTAAGYTAMVAHVLPFISAYIQSGRLP